MDDIWSSAVFMTGSYFLYPTGDFKSLVVWDMERQHTLGQLVGHDDTIQIVAARGRLAVSSQSTGPVRARVWNLETMQCTATLPDGGANGTVSWSACCMEGKVLLGQDDGGVMLWDIAASAPVALAGLEGHNSVVRDIKTTAAAGNMVLSGSDDKTMRLWDLRNCSRCVRTMEGHDSLCVHSVDMDGHCHTAVSGTWDNAVRLWDLGSGRCMETHTTHDDLGALVRDVVMHESGGIFLSSDYIPVSDEDGGIVNAWAVGSTRAVMRADMASCCVPSSDAYRLFANGDFSTVAYCSMSSSRLGLSVWR